MIIFLISNVVGVFAQYQPDPTGDCYWGNLGNGSAESAAPCEPYMDIVGSEVSMSGGSYNGTILFAGNVPSTTNSSSTYIEWDIMIDSDRNAKTNEWCGYPCQGIYNSTVNGIGVDYMVRFWMQGLSSGAQIFDGSRSSNRWIDISSYKVTGNQIQLYWLPGDIGGSSFFDFVILVRVYGNGGAVGSLRFFDKAPNVGHYEFQGGQVSVVPELAAPPIVALIVIMMTLGLFNYHKRIRGTKWILASEKEKRKISFGSAVRTALLHQRVRHFHCR